MPIKRGTTPTLQVKIGIDDLSTISTVDFMLKQNCDEGCTVKVKKTYPGQYVTLNQTTGVFSISYTENETRVFEHDTKIYLDVRPVLTNGKIVPTEIVSLFVSPTLFAATEVTND